MVPFKNHLVQLPYMKQGHLPLDQIAQRCIQPGLEHFQASNSFAGQLVPMSHPPQYKKKKIFPCIQLNLSSFTLELFPLVLSLVSGKKCVSYKPPLYIERSHSLLYRLSNPSPLSLFSQHRYSNPLTVSMTFLWTCSNSFTSFLC